MKHLILLLILSTGCCLATVQASELIADPEVDFVNTPEVVRAEFGILKKDRLLRLDLDLNGTGRPTIFLAFNGDRSGFVWAAYSYKSSGYVRTDGIQFREDFFRAGIVPDLNPSGGLLVFYPGKGAGKLVRYPFSDGQVQPPIELRILDYSKTEDRDLFEHIFGRKLTDSMPKEYFTNPPHQVIDVKKIMARINVPKITTQPPITIPSVTESSSVPMPTRPLPVEKQTPKPAGSPTPKVQSVEVKSSSVVPIAAGILLLLAVAGFVFYRRKP